MQIDLSREDIINLLRGTNPHYDVMKDPIVRTLGSYTGGFHDKWDWKCAKTIERNSFTDEQLYATYLLCKNSWK